MKILEKRKLDVIKQIDYYCSMIHETLSKLGLSEKEISVYLEVVKHGQISPAYIARITKINRTTVYSVAKELAKKGFIAEDLAGKTGSLVAVPVEDLQFLIKKEEKQLEQKKYTMHQMIEQLQTLTRSKYAIPKITFIQEQDLEDYLFKRSTEWHKSIMKYDRILWGFQDHSFAQSYEKWVDWEWQQGGPPGLQLRLLTNKSEIEEKNKIKGYTRREIKYWDKGNFTASVWVHGDYLIMVVTKQRPHYLVEIYDGTLAYNMREFFKGVWNEIKPTT